VFGPVALILYAIPQCEWVTWFWLREVVGWATTPLLVTACLAMAIPLASGRAGFLAAAAFGIAGFQAAYDLVGLFSYARGGGGECRRLRTRAWRRVSPVGAEQGWPRPLSPQTA
jgi:hypothetical protein